MSGTCYSKALKGVFQNLDFCVVKEQCHCRATEQLVPATEKEAEKFQANVNLANSTCHCHTYSKVYVLVM